MRVLHVMASGARGGGLTHLLDVLPALSAMGLDIRVALGNDGPGARELAARGIVAEALPLMGRRLSPLAPLRLAQWVRRQGGAIVHAHGTRAAFYLTQSRAAWGAQGRKLVYTAHGLSYHQEAPLYARWLRRRAEAQICRAADHVISVSSSDLEELVHRRLIAPHRGTFIGNAVDVSRFGRITRRDARAQLNLNVDDFVLGSVCRLVPQKAVHDLFGAVARCGEDLAGCVILIAGEGPERPALEAMAQRLPIPVRFLGGRAAVPTVLAALDVFVLTSRWEGQPIALWEALAAGVPVVATDTPGAREVLGSLGERVPVGDRDALAAAILALRARPEERARRGAEGRARAQRQSPQGVGREIRQVYQRVLAPGLLGG